jgi:hypothetical protein
MLDQINQKEAPAAHRVSAQSPRLPTLLLLALRSAHAAGQHLHWRRDNSASGATQPSDATEQRTLEEEWTLFIERKGNTGNMVSQHGGTKVMSCKGRSPEHGTRGCQFFDESGGYETAL